MWVLYDSGGNCYSSLSVTSLGGNTLHYSYLAVSMGSKSVLHVCVWALLNLCCCTLNQTQVFHIAPDGHCTVDGTTLRECYTLQQLVADKDLLSRNGTSSVELLLLHGTHLIPEGLNVSNFSRVVIQPWSEDREVEIKCTPRESVGPIAMMSYRIHFEDITDLNIISIRFMSCKLLYESSSNERQMLKGSISIEKCSFEKSKNGYAISIPTARPKLNVSIAHSMFSSNRGGLIRVESRADGIPLLQIDNSSFQSNWREHSEMTPLGGNPLLWVDGWTLIITNTHFANNSADSLVATQRSEAVLYNTNFSKNINSTCVSLSHSHANVSHCHFTDNTNTIEAKFSVIFFMIGHRSYHTPTSTAAITRCTFEGNRAVFGVLWTESVQVNVSLSEFRNNSAIIGGAIHVTNYFERSHKFSIIHSVFMSNEAEADGGAIYCEDKARVEISGGFSTLNSAVDGRGGFAYLTNCDVVISDHDIYASSATRGGVIYARDTRITVDANTTMANNTATVSGGALYLDRSQLLMYNSTLLTLDSNAAHERGGAIYAVDNNCDDVPGHFHCFFGPQIRLNFTNNTAPEGSILYGGLLDRCTIIEFAPNFDPIRGIDSLKSVLDHNPAPSDITSGPVTVCLCTDDYKANCTTREVAVSKMGGQTISLIGVIMDQNRNPKSSYLRARYLGGVNAQLGEGEGTTSIGNGCKKLSFHVYTSNDSAMLGLSPDGVCEQSRSSTVTINITVMPCFKGFEIHGDRCGCDRRLTEHFNITVCDITSYTVQRKGSIWLRYEKYLKVHSNCPLGYCQVTSDTISLASPDQQCADDRSGVLCGACRANYSIGLGGSKCLPCGNSYYFLWLVPLFAVAGVALVALLLVLNMTVSQGTLNGLILYANFVSITGITGLQDCSIPPVLSAFIAWVNLDFGVETCFYSGMDTYQKTWLQFIFPLYIWLLVGAIVLVSHCSTTAMKLIGRNNMALLATLFLLSYTKILKTTITALNFTRVFQSSANNTSDQLVYYIVWTQDGNIEYLKGKHMPLFIVALLLMLLLFIPYTLLLTFGQCIRSLPTRRRYILWCINSTTFVSIMDAYHAPYNERHRYWTGLMLLARCVLLLAFAFRYNESKLLVVNLYLTTLVIIAIFTLKSLIPKVYKRVSTGLLELSFLLNLMVLTSTLLYLRETKSSSYHSCAFASASISVSMILFIGILIYHATLQLQKRRCFERFKESFHIVFTKVYDKILEEKEVAEPEPIKLPTTTTVALREVLLED